MDTSPPPGAEHAVTRLPMPGPPGARVHPSCHSQVAVYQGSMPQIPHPRTGPCSQSSDWTQGTGTPSERVLED